MTHFDSIRVQPEPRREPVKVVKKNLGLPEIIIGVGLTLSYHHKLHCLTVSSCLAI